MKSVHSSPGATTVAQCCGKAAQPVVAGRVLARSAFGKKEVSAELLPIPEEFHR